MNREAERQRAEDMREQAHAMAMQRALDRKAKLAQQIAAAPNVYSCDVERAPNQTYFMVKFNEQRIPADFLEDYGLELKSLRLVTPRKMFPVILGRKWPLAVATLKEDGDSE